VLSSEPSLHHIDDNDDLWILCKNNIQNIPKTYITHDLERRSRPTGHLVGLLNGRNGNEGSRDASLLPIALSLVNISPFECLFECVAD
jgi:hypothetical protein